ncbi:PREDICTED: uncharacterized protein LOC106324282 [Brassica oleracea var. oleracea]|uniref:uncharacterized protein LOC106324282 n=1 Tax=Brassica oleracea var. oleracea TaxID=109376 RepID=UPI0006A7061A|nr:PREDICTED: uncharacterized protein LOC106324282 [Brassica oleracea var. oleracea]
MVKSRDRGTSYPSVSFSIVAIYKDKIYCDIVPMDLGHLIFGRPWQYDRETTHDGKRNCCRFVIDNRTITLLPKDPSLPSPASQATCPAPTQPVESCSKPALICSVSAFEEELRQTGFAFALLSVSDRAVSSQSHNMAFSPLLEEYTDVFPDDLQKELPPL